MAILTFRWKHFVLNDWSLEPITMTKFCVSSVEVLCFVFTAATFSCSFVGLSGFSFVFNNWKACSFDLDQVTDHWKMWYHRGNFFALINFQVAFAVWVESLFIWCTVTCILLSLAIWGGQYSPVHFRFHPAISTHIINTSAAVHAHTISKTMFDRWCRRCDMVLIMNSSSLSILFYTYHFSIRSFLRTGQALLELQPPQL